MSDSSPLARTSDGAAVGRPAPPQARRGARALVIVAGVLVVVGLAPLAVGLLGAVVLYEICERPYTWLAQRIAPRLAAVVFALVVAVLVAAPAIWLTDHLVVRLPAVRAALAGSYPAGADSASLGALAQLGGRAAQARSAIASWLPGALLSIGGSAAWALMNWSIALLGLYYLLGSTSADWLRFARILPLSPAGVDTLRVRLQDASRAMVAGTLLSAAIQGAAIGTGIWLAGLPEAPFWGVVAAIATLVPLVGNALVWLPPLLFLALEHRYQGALMIGFFGGLLPPVIDRVVRASVSRRMGQVHPMITLVGALAGIRVAGVAGLVLGPVALAMFFALLDVYAEEYTAGPSDPAQ